MRKMKHIMACMTVSFLLCASAPVDAQRQTLAQYEASKKTAAMMGGRSSKSSERRRQRRAARAVAPKQAEPPDPPPAPAPPSAIWDMPPLPAPSIMVPEPLTCPEPSLDDLLSFAVWPPLEAPRPLSPQFPWIVLAFGVALGVSASAVLATAALAAIKR